jgi:hypothetical protein
VSELFNIARAAGLDPYQSRGYFSNATKEATALAGSRTHYFDPDTLKYFHSRVSRVAIAADGMALVTLESASADPNNARRGYRINVHDLTGRVINDRQDVGNLIASKRAADRAFNDAVYACEQTARHILAAAITRETSRHARALEDLKVARRSLAKAGK